jgi:hypothetical protein
MSRLSVTSEGSRRLCVRIYPRICRASPSMVNSLPQHTDKPSRLHMVDVVQFTAFCRLTGLSVVGCAPAGTLLQ